MKFICDTEEKLNDVANYLLSMIKDRENVVIALQGDLGSGKTTFTKYLAKKLGVNDVVTSPTFVIQKRFDIKYENYNNLYHIDAYRLKDESELKALNWDEIISTRGNIIVIEWPEIIEKALPDNVVHLNFTTINESTREIEMVE